MAELKTKPTKVSVAGYLAAIKNDARRQDCEAVVKMMTRVTKEKPVMWGPSIIGFGKYHYKYDSGHEGDMCIAGFASRKDAIVIYLMPDILADKKRMARLGKHTHGKSCLYVKKLEDVDVKVLEQLVKDSVAEGKRLYP